MFLLFATCYSFPKITDLTMIIFYNVWQSFGILSCKIIRYTYTWVTKLVALLRCGAFYWHDLGPVKRKVTANQYISINPLYPRMKHFYPDGNALFQDNQVLIHRAWLLAEWLDEWENDVKYIHNHQISTHLNTYGRFFERSVRRDSPSAAAKWTEGTWWSKALPTHYAVFPFNLSSMTFIGTSWYIWYLTFT